MASGGLIGMPSSGSSAPLDARSGGHHQPYYGHQTSPTQYYHTQQKYPEPILHQGQHQLQLGGSLANDSPPMSAGLHQGNIIMTISHRKFTFYGKITRFVWN